MTNILSNAVDSVVHPLMMQFKLSLMAPPATPNRPTAVYSINGAGKHSPVPEIHPSLDVATDHITDRTSAVEPLDTMTKDELLDLAAKKQVKVAKSWNKAKIIAALSQSA